MSRFLPVEGTSHLPPSSRRDTQSSIDLSSEYVRECVWVLAHGCMFIVVQLRNPFLMSVILDFDPRHSETGRVGSQGWDAGCSSLAFSGGSSFRTSSDHG